MKEGEACDLLKRLGDCPEFGIGEQEMAQLLDPARFIGRCPQQVDAFLAGLQPLLCDVQLPVNSIQV